MLKFERSYLRNFHGKVEVEFLHSPTLSQSFYLALDFLPPSNFSISHFSLSENVGHLPQLILLPACLASPQIWVDIRPADRSFVLRVLLFEVLKSPLHLNSPSDPQNPFSLSLVNLQIFFSPFFQKSALFHLISLRLFADFTKFQRFFVIRAIFQQIYLI